MRNREILLAAIRVSRSSEELVRDRLAETLDKKLPAARARVDAARAEMIAADDAVNALIAVAEEDERAENTEVVVQRDLAQLLVEVELGELPWGHDIEERILAIRDRAEGLREAEVEGVAS